jgi:hypothetical protein
MYWKYFSLLLLLASTVEGNSKVYEVPDGMLCHFENQVAPVHLSFSDLKFLLRLENIAVRTDR